MMTEPDGFDDGHDDDEIDDECAHCDYGCCACTPQIECPGCDACDRDGYIEMDGPNGCTCGFNGDCNCRFVP